ncbi:hypothetical protein THAOC_12375 [Thalassiosira oceanica]|uniref:Uncharacterized protein n=1 Tax=Thalassiosira oceanica TaxID=159749 RepID=K0T8D2_THAOC|nr:hypothetical protein THAOC_12375 [Thalassiosira oceanica]|eukprot:EJK66682.1 hypothetical protein THAOC_12375 [Thalassiosira oceanica]
MEPPPCDPPHIRGHPLIDGAGPSLPLCYRHRAPPWGRGMDVSLPARLGAALHGVSSGAPARGWGRSSSLQGRRLAPATVSATTTTGSAATDDDCKRAPPFLRRQGGQTVRRGGSTPPSPCHDDACGPWFGTFSL